METIKQIKNISPNILFKSKCVGYINLPSSALPNFVAYYLSFFARLIDRLTVLFDVLLTAFVNENIIIYCQYIIIHRMVIRGHKNVAPKISWLYIQKMMRWKSDDVKQKWGKIDAMYYFIWCTKNIHIQILIFYEPIPSYK